MANESAKQCKQHFNELKANRSNFESMWEDISKFIIPHRGQFSIKNSPGQKNRGAILDSTGSWASEQLANFLYGALTNPATQWFNLGTYDMDLAKRYDVKQYLTLCTNHMYSILNSPRKKFYDNAHEMYNDVVPFGTGIMLLEDRPGTGASFRSRFLYECYLDEDYDSNVDTCYREFELTLRQIVQQFGEDSLPEDLQRVIDKDPGKKLAVIHGIYPRDTYEKSEDSNNKMPWASKYFLPENGDHVLKDGGFRRFPVLAPRWTKRSDEIYGRGPGSMALAEVRMIQKMKETTLKGGQKMVDPPLQVPDNTFLSPLNLTPGAINYHNPIFEGAGAKEIITNARPDFGIDLMDRETQAILRAFYVDKLSSQKNPNVEQTRTEFLGEQQERLILMAPQLGRMHSEFNGQLIEQLYMIERMTGRLPQPPEALRGKPLVVQYKSPLARAQQMQRLQDATGAVQDLSQLAPVFPEILDTIDPDGLAGWIFMARDTPSDVLRPEDQVKQIREQKQEQMQMQAQLEQAKTGSEAAANVAKLMPKGGQRVAG